jgi:hypothetical protein
MILKGFIRKAARRLAGMDIVGDWSPVEVAGLFRKGLAWTGHPALRVDADRAATLNTRTNRAILSTLRAQGLLGGGRRAVAAGDASPPVLMAGRTRVTPVRRGD